MFARIAGRYDLMNAVMTLGMDSRWRCQAAKLTDLPAKGLALDLASGTGDFALALATLPSRPFVVALDFSPQMLAAATRKFDQARVSSRVAPVLGDALTLPFADSTFHAATMGFGLRNVASIPRMLGEIHRVLRPGGRFVNLELTPLRSRMFAPFFRLYFDHLVPLIGGLTTGDLKAYTYLPRSLRPFPDAPSLSRLMGEARFAEVSCRLAGLGTVAIHVGRK